jgi:alkanesulfonate monooxygenase SsuD/methylene tetrahydromethanopterin reductase-like flavin-dependent oxidoreductase (luciferase family)
MIEYADVKGFDNVIFAEHHASEDGYIPTPALMAAAAGVRTQRIATSLNALVLPLHDPVKLAETIAVADLICGGRLHTVFAAGYAHNEFAAFRKSLKNRGMAMDHGLEVISRALAGERFMDGDREVFVRPLPASPPKLYVGGGVPISAKRAARFGMGYSPLGPEVPALFELYDEENRKRGRPPGSRIPRSIGLFVAEDVDEGWRVAGEYILHVARVYASLSADASESNSPLHGLTTSEALRKSGIMRVATPDECVEISRRGASISIMPLIAGLAPDVGWKSLELFAEQALPRINEAAAEGAGEPGGTTVDDVVSRRSARRRPLGLHPHR